MVVVGDLALDELRELHRAGNLVLVLGEGISEAAALPGRKRLVALLVEHARARGVEDVQLVEVEQLASKDRLIDALSALEDVLGANEFGVTIEHHLDDRDLPLPEVVEAIGAIAPGLRAILSTNIDLLIERATRGEIPLLTSATGDLAQRRGFILKLNGTLPDRSTWVFTRQRHDAVYADPVFQQVFSAIFHSSTMLFVGSELTEDVFGDILRQARAILGQQPVRHFALMVKDSGQTHHRRGLGRAGVSVIEYENPDGTHGEVSRILRELAAISKPVDRNDQAPGDDLDLAHIWPGAIPVAAPPPLETHHIRRSDLVARIVDTQGGKAIEVGGISGSGKTSLAAETIEHLLKADPDRAVYYAEVRSEDRLRNVLVGVAFELRLMGFDAALGLAVRSGVAEEQAIRDVARALGAADRSILLLIDLVEGTCNPGFARHLAAFVRAIASPRVRVVIFGHERALRDLTPLEREENGVEYIDVRGLHFEEFVKLVGQFHADADRAELWDVFARVTAGRAGYLFAALAHALARAASLAKMKEIAASPPDVMLSHAEQQRFAKVSLGARSAAEKLVCFLLPFRQEDAEAIFPEDNVALAVRELLTQGLLRQRDAERFEMHETVRAGLEVLLAIGTRRRAHEAIAVWCRERGLLAAEILHLGKAGKRDDAHQRAREAFLAGQHWEALAAYTTEHRLVSAQEVVSLLTQDTLPDNAYLLLGILRKIGNANAAEELLRQVRDQQERFDKDYQWAWKMVEATLDCDSTKLYELLQFALESNVKRGGRHTRLDWLRTGARRAEMRIDARVLELFRGQPPDTQLHMLPILLLDRRRESLKEAFQFLVSYEKPVDWRRLGELVTPEVPLRLERPTDVVEFLAALPMAEPSAMLVAKSALLGPFAGLVWSQRHILREQCIKILRVGAEDSDVLENAIRVLAFLAEPSLLDLCAPLVASKGRLEALATLVPTLIPTLVDTKAHETRFLDSNRSVEERTGSLVVLAAAGADLGNLISKLNEPDPKRTDLFKFLALMHCVANPFEGAIPWLEEHLSKVDSTQAKLLAPIVMQLGALPVPSAMEMLVRCLAHSDPHVRMFAAVTLGHRRSRRALPALLGNCAEEEGLTIADAMAVSAIASGPRSSFGFETIWPKLSTGRLWRCILTARLRNAAGSEILVATATDTRNHWQIRRAAILAAGRLPYEAALKNIVPVVLQERSPFHIDQNHGMLAHSVLALLTLEESSGMRSRFVAGKNRFVNLFGDIFEDCWRDDLSRDDGLPTGKAAAEWLFDRLTHHGWPGNHEAPDLVVWELHVPILHAAVLRSLRLCGKPELIDEQISAAYHPWFLLKCIKERSAVDGFDSAAMAKLKVLTATSQWRQSYFVMNMFRNMTSRLPARRAEAEAVLRTAQELPSVTGTGVQYGDIVRALTDSEASFSSKPPFVLEVLAAGEFEHLVALLDPSMDYKYMLSAPPEPAFQFLSGGYTIGTGHANQVDNRRELRAALRPAVAAANKFLIAIPWHRELLFDAGYVQSFFNCLAAQNDADRFYDELSCHVDLLMPGLGDPARVGQVLKFMDARMVPFLARYSGAGTDTFFEALCAVSRRIDLPEIDPVLAALFYRWAQRFDHRSKNIQHAENHAIWRALGHLNGHPRFVLIPGYETRLSTVMKMQIHWFHKRQIVRTLEKSPRAYVEIESMLMRTASFEHYFEDEVDRLDEAADRLFHQLLEESDSWSDSVSNASSGRASIPRQIDGGESRPTLVSHEPSKVKTTVLEVLDGWDLLKEGVKLQNYSMKNWRELSRAVERAHESVPGPALGSVHLGLFESTRIVEGDLPVNGLVVPLMAYERLWLPDPAFSFFSHEASEVWKRVPESGSTYFTGKCSIRTSWNTLWTAPADTRKALILEHLPKILGRLSQLRPLIEDGSIGLLPWERLLFPQLAEFRNVISEVKDARPLLDSTTKFDQSDYNLGCRLGAIGIGITEDQPGLKLKAGDKLHFADKTHMILTGMLHARICSTVGASFLPSLRGDRAVYEFLNGIGAQRLLTPPSIVLPSFEDAPWDDIVAVRKSAEALADIRCVLTDASAIVDESEITAIQARLEEAASKLKEDASIWRSANWSTTDVTVSIAIGTGSGMATGSPVFDIAPGTFASIAALTSSVVRSAKDAKRTETTQASEILVRGANRL